VSVSLTLYAMRKLMQSNLGQAWASSVGRATCWYVHHKW